MRSPVTNPLAAALLGLGLLLPRVALPAVGITAPAAGSGSVSGSQDSPTQVGTDTWVVTCDEVAGATLLIEAPRFTHALDPAYKADIRLDLAILSGAAWAGGTSQSTSTSTTPALVTASSGSPGNASFEVRVTFVPGDASVLGSGSYQTTITGTITAN